MCLTMPGSQGEVMWPRLVANKILKKRLGSSNFVADFPRDTEPTVELTSLDPPSLSLDSTFNPHNEHKEIHTYKVFVSTWNVGGIAPQEDLCMEEWLGTGHDVCDIYVLGFQEIVPLRASNILGSEKSKISTEWNSLIREALNKKIIGYPEKNKKQSLPPIMDEKKADQHMSLHDLDFRCVISRQMVGLLITVWVRSDLRPYIRHPSVSCVGCGIMGCLGNKGSVSVRFRLHETSFCFVCCHLASGGREGDEKHRNSDVAEILSRTTFPRGPSLDLPRKILDHDRVIFLGDLNYRISLPESTIRSLVDGEEWNVLLDNDQLRMELMSGQAFDGWQEGTIKFAPTYKYCPNSNVYFGCVEGKKGEKWRAPAWCDRIVWCGEGLKQHLYTRGESNFSDHRPVKARFTAQVEVLRTLKGLQKFFLSERFDQITSKFDRMSPPNKFLRKSRSSFKL